MKPTEQYHSNFLKVMERIMYEQGMNQTEFAAWLGVNRVTVYKISERKQAPTLEQGITLCLRTGIDANWLFLNKGTNPTRLATRVTTHLQKPRPQPNTAH